MDKARHTGLDVMGVCLELQVKDRVGLLTMTHMCKYMHCNVMGGDIKEFLTVIGKTSIANSTIITIQLVSSKVLNVT